MNERNELLEKRVLMRMQIEMAIRQVCPDCKIMYNPYEKSEWDIQIKINDSNFDVQRKAEEERLWRQDVEFWEAIDAEENNRFKKD
jgi:hypothetical protein